MSLEFEWDPAKAAFNQRKHGVSFMLAATVFGDPFLNTVRDEAHSAHEERFFSMGEAVGGRILVVIHTFVETGAIPSVRIITARNATRKEINQYKENSHERYH